MDNIFQLLIFLFVIYTIYNSLFGKKKPQRPQNNFPRNEPEEDELKSSPQPRYSSTDDILENLFGMKIPKTGGEYEDLNRNNIPQDYETDLPDIEKQVELAGGKITDINYDQLSTDELQQKLNWDEDANKAYESSKSLSMRTVELKQKIKNPATLRKLYLISEIINKPKALRR